MPELCKLKISSFQEIMRQYNVWQLAKAIAFLVESELVAGSNSSGFDSGGVITIRADDSVPGERMNNLYVPMLKYCQTQCEELELSAALARFPHFNQEIRQGITWNELRNQLKILHEAIHADLCFRRFAYVPTVKASLHDKRGLEWSDIWSKIPESKEDSERAIDCYALEQDTACVFHLMRVAEFGLRALARKVGARITHTGRFCPLEFGEWDKVITAIKNKIDTARKLAAGLKKQAQLEFYSDAADHCTFMKDIWRNNVSHARKPYKDAEALAVLGRVRDFMKFLSQHLSEKKKP